MPLNSQNGHFEALKKNVQYRENKMNVFWYLNSLLQEHLSTNTMPLSHLALEHRLYAEGEIRKMVSPIKKSSKCNESEVNHIVSTVSLPWKSPSLVKNNATLYPDMSRITS